MYRIGQENDQYNTMLTTEATVGPFIKPNIKIALQTELPTILDDYDETPAGRSPGTKHQEYKTSGVTWATGIDSAKGFFTSLSFPLTTLFSIPFNFSSTLSFFQGKCNVSTALNVVGESDVVTSSDDRDAMNRQAVNPDIAGFDYHNYKLNPNTLPLLRLPPTTADLQTGIYTTTNNKSDEVYNIHFNSKKAKEFGIKQEYPRPGIDTLIPRLIPHLRRPTEDNEVDKIFPKRKVGELAPHTVATLEILSHGSTKPEKVVSRE
jgi:hypothetical protein